MASLQGTPLGRQRLARLADAILAELRARPPPPARRPGPLRLEDGSFI